MIGRRGFLFGTLTAAAGAGTALLTATPHEVAVFGKPLLGPVSLFQPEPDPSVWADIRPLGAAGKFVYNHKGEAIGVISEMAVERRPVETTSWGSEYRYYARGLLEVRYNVVGTGFAQ